MKKIFILLIFISFTFSMQLLAQEIGDEWDPNDDLAENATPLPIPTIDDVQHGPHTLSASDPYDWFKVVLEKDVTYDFYAAGESDTTGELFAEDGITQVAHDDDNGPIINFRIIYTPTESGVFYLRVRMYAPTQDGAYTLQYAVRSGIDVPPDEWDPDDDLAVGATVIGAPTLEGIEHGPHILSETDLNDWFALTLTQGETYAIVSTGDSDVYGELYFNDGSTRVAMDDDGEDGTNFKIVYTAAQGGTFLLRVSMFESSYIGSYSIIAKSGAEPLPSGDEWDPGDDLFDGATDLGSPTKNLQQHGPHELSGVDRFDWFRLTLTAGALYRFYSLGSSKTIADLYEPDGVTLISTAEGEEADPNFSLSFSPESTNVFFLRVRSFQDRDARYSLAFIKESDPLPSQLDAWDSQDDVYSGATNLGEPTEIAQQHGSHNLSLEDLEDWYVFQLFAGKKYEFWTSGTADTVGELYRSDGTTAVTQQDEGGSGYNFRISFSPLVNATYYLKVRMFDRGSRGSYTLQYSQELSIPTGTDSWDPSDDVWSGASDVGAIQSVDKRHGPHTLSETDREDWFSLSLAVGASYEISTLGDSDTAAVLYMPDGVTPVVESDDGGTGYNFVIYYKPSVSGVYYLKVFESAGTDASYTLTARGVRKDIESIEPIKVFDLQSSDEFAAYPGIYYMLPPGSVTVGSIPADINGFTDNRGATLTTGPGEAIQLMFPEIQTGGRVALIRASFGSDGSGAAVGLAAVDGSREGSIVTNIPADSGIYQSRYRWQTLTFDYPAESIIPVVQLANKDDNESVSVFLNTLEIYLLPEDSTIPSSLLSTIVSGNSENWFPTLPAPLYDLSSSDQYIEQPGGFINAEPGSVEVGSIPVDNDDIDDGVGAILTVRDSQVEMIVLPTITVNDDVVLVRARVRSNGGDADVALACFDGSLDGSIATNISLNSADFEDDYQWVTLSYNVPGQTITPVVQLAGEGLTEEVSLYVDAVEIYRLPAGSGIPTILFYGE